MSICLELTLSRDLNPKFVPSSDDRLRSSTPNACWQLAGQFDYLDVRPIDRLGEIGIREEYSDFVAIGAHTGLVLTPLGSTKIPNSFTELIRTHPSNNDGLFHQHAKSHPVLTVLRLSLSAVAYELGEDFTSVLDSTDSAYAMINEEVNLRRSQSTNVPTEFHCFRTLSAPDIVVMATPSSAAQLHEFDRICQRIMKMKLSELAVRSQIQNPSQFPGHAFAAADEWLAFRPNSAGELIWDDEDESETGIQFHVSMRLDCGHDASFLNSVVTEVIRDVNTTRESLRDVSTAIPESHTQGVHSVHMRFTRFQDYYDVIWKSLSNNPAIKLAHIVDVSTTVSFGAHFSNDSDDDAHCMAWRLSDEFWEEVDEIVKRISRWSAKFLTSTQHRELLNAIKTFQSCFLHHELASAARDLLPFLRQFSLACSEDTYSLWAEYLAHCEAEAFTDDVSTLLSHLGRAVRNRLEHRSSHADPTVPHTLDHGANKLVNAFTAMYWLTNEFFSDRDRDESNDANYCYADTLAVCVAAGHQNRVSCVEVFEDFRRYYESKIQNSISVAKPGGWSARLLLLEISGPPLLRPEIALVHTMHETAEFSDWLRAPQTEVLRYRLNRWILYQYDAILKEVVMKAVEKAWRDELPRDRQFRAFAEQLRVPVRETNKELWDELFQFIQRLFPVALSSAVKVHAKQCRLEQTADAAEDLEGGELLSTGRKFEQLDSYDYSWIEDGIDLLCLMHPVDFCSLVSDAVAEFVPNYETWQESLENSRLEELDAPFSPLPTRVPLLARVLIDVLSSESGRMENSFGVIADHLSALVREVSADCGMWCGMSHLLNIENGKKQSLNHRARLLNLHAVFISILRSTMMESSPAAHHISLVLYRWAIQAAAVSREDKWEGGVVDYINSSGLTVQRNGEEKLLRDEVNRILHVHEGVSVEGAVQAFRRTFSMVFSKKFSLVESLRSVSNYDEDEFLYDYTYSSETTLPEFDLLSRLGFPETMDDMTVAEQRLWRQFLMTWKLSRRAMATSETSNALSEELGESRIDLALHMYAKSVRLRYKKMFKKAK